MVTILGVVVGVLAVLAAMVLKHIPFVAFMNPAAFVIIIVGTVASILNSFTARELKNIGSLFKILFGPDKKGNERKIIEDMVNFAAITRKDGFLALESKLNEIDDPFMHKGIKMVCDGADADFIRDLMNVEIDAMKERHAINASIFTSAGTYAPTLGVLGAVFGLIAAMSNINDVGIMAEAVAAAFMATILGIFTGYVLWTPFSVKLKTKSRTEVAEKMMVIEGILSLQHGDPPIRIREKLLAMLPPSVQNELSKEERADA